ncbi:MAG: AraC family transcriptional regulator [Armatimonadota bacterium]
MQIRSYEIADRKYDPIILDKDFPVAGGDKISISKSPDFLHRHNVLEIGYCYEGCGVFIIGDDVYSFSAGDVCIIDSEAFHIARSSGDQVSTWAFIYVDPYRFSASLAPGSYLIRVAKFHKAMRPPLLRHVKYPEVSSIVRQILDEMQKKNTLFEISAGGLIASLVVRLYRIGEKTNATSRFSDNTAMERIVPALQHIATHYMEQISMRTLGELCFLSNAQLRRLFHLAVGQSPQSYLIRFRMRMSASLLSSTTLQILDIANRVGYPSISSFNRHFKDQFGTSPREWRGSYQDSTCSPKEKTSD